MQNHFVLFVYLSQKVRIVSYDSPFAQYGLFGIEVLQPNNQWTLDHYSNRAFTDLAGDIL
jgi:hypothetical protein